MTDNDKIILVESPNTKQVLDAGFVYVSYKVKISPWMVFYNGMSGTTSIIDTRPGGKSRMIDNLITSIRYRERHNLRLGIRAYMRRLHIFAFGHNTRSKITPTLFIRILYHWCKQYLKMVWRCDIRKTHKRGWYC